METCAYASALETLRTRIKRYVIKQELIFRRKDRTNIPERTRTFI
jgi:hypothetical protein